MKQAKPINNSKIVQTFDYTPFVRMGLISLFITFGILLIWSAMAPLKSAVVANGQISVASKNKTVQHLDGGKVKNIAVKDGELVEQGQLLLQLDSNLLKIHHDSIEKQLFEISSHVERLKAERDDKDSLIFSTQLNENAHSNFAKETLLTQQNLFHSRRTTLHSEQKVLQQRLVQYSKQISSLKLQLKTIHTRIALLKEDISGLKTLMGKQFVAKTKYRELKRTQSRLMGELFSNESNISRLTEIYI